MKVSIGMKLVDGAWGGGNQFALSLTRYLIKQGNIVINHLNDDDIDIILLTDPRKESVSATFNHIDINRYKEKNQNCIVIHRVNECDERKGTKGVNEQIIEANEFADYTVFVSSWLAALFFSQGIQSKNYSVILNGSDLSIFNDQGYHFWNHQEPLRIVTHHWGGNWLKGFDIYQRLDNMLKNPDFFHRFKFMYIGNLPNKFNFYYSDYVSPLSGTALATKIKENHVYLTASQNEPGGHHQNEGALCGLPVLYRDSGCLPEYCSGYGLSFSQDDIIDKIEMIRDEYDFFCRRMSHYPHTSEKMVQQYYELFQKLYERNSHNLKIKCNSSIFLNVRNKIIQLWRD